MQNNNNSVIYSDSFGVEHIPKEIKAFNYNNNNNNNNNNKNITIFLEYKNMIRKRVDIFVLDLLTLCLQEKH